MRLSKDFATPVAAIPMVTERTERGEWAIDIYSLLLRNRIVLNQVER